MNWARTKLGEVVEIYDHIRVPLSAAQRATRKGPYPYYGAQGIIDSVDDYLFDGRYLLVPEDGENLNTRKLPIAFFATGRFWVNNHAHILRGRTGIVGDEFLKHLLTVADISGYITGAAQPKLSQENLKRIELRIPPLDIQRRIAGILSAYDDLIEVNTRRIAILEEMARRLFDEWFVKFRFPGHEGVAFKKSSVGRVPEGWEVKAAGEVIGFDPPTTVQCEGEKPFVPMNSLSTSSMTVDGIEMRSGNGGSKFRSGDTLLARITPCLENGKTAFVDFLREGEVGFGSTEFVVMRGRTVSSEWVYLLARSEPFRAHAIKSMSGATGRQRVRVESLKRYLIAEPSAQIVEEFTGNARPMFEQIQVLARANRNLRAARDLLLPKLISGEIDLSGAERQTKRAAKRAAAE